MKTRFRSFPPHFFSYWLKLFFVLASLSVFIFYFYDQQLSRFCYTAVEKSHERSFVGEITDMGDAANYIIVLSLLWIWFVVLVPRMPKMQKWQNQWVDIKNLVIQCMLAIIVAGTFTEIIKILVGRQRPRCGQNFDPYFFKHLAFDPHFHSFPSGHSEFIFCFMTILAFKWQKLREVFFIFAIMVSLSRVLLGQHFFSDILMGAFIGSFLASVTHYLARERWPLLVTEEAQISEPDWVL